MSTTLTEFQTYLAAPESARLEFKEAKGGLHFEELVKYCVALANEGGGKIIFGVTDARPRQIVGTVAFAEPGRTQAGLYQSLSRRFYAETGQKGVYTRKRGLDRESNKALLLKHIQENAATGAKLDELRQVIPALSVFQVQTLVRDLKRAGLILNQGATNAARWFPVLKRNKTQ